VAIVDTGTGAIGTRFDDAFTALSVGWNDVDHVLLTHLHGDHVGGLGEVLEAAPDAKAYAGEADVAGIDSPRTLNPVNDGDEVFGLQIVGTPGHTAGHVSVFDSDAGLLVAGDALIGSDGTIGGPSPRFSADIDEANASVGALAGLAASTVVFGHGEPVETDVAASINSLAESL
jgi:glyoxylase-like metal-dependent hydrolase (beta-lactamase superfamily II)